MYEDEERQAREATPERDTQRDLALAQHAGVDAAACDQLMRRLRPRVQRLCASFLRNGADVDDATQAALLEVLRGVGSFRGESSLEGWADRIAVRTALRLARTRRLSAVRDHGDLDPDELPARVQATGDADALPRALQVYLDALPEARRSVLVLHHALGYSVAEIAELTGVSVNTVKDRLLSAREQVRKLVRRDVGVLRGDAATRERKP